MATSRYKSFKLRYDKTHKVAKETGWGLTEQEEKDGVTIVDKLESICPLYKRMDTLFGHRQNINASHTINMEEEGKFILYILLEQCC